MNSRLQQFLELENLTPARLADILGVQRSGLSHILSGRNKPGYDFILKLLTKFPSINAEWVLTGKGKPYKELTTLSPSSRGQSGNGIFNQESIPSPNQRYKNQSSHDIQSPNQSLSNIQYTDISLADQPILNESDKNLGLENDWEANSLFSPVNTQTVESDKLDLETNNQNLSGKKNASQASENSLNGMKPGFVRKERNIKRVIVFYSDGSFEELFPQK